MRETSRVQSHILPLLDGGGDQDIALDLNFGKETPLEVI